MDEKYQGFAVGTRSLCKIMSLDHSHSLLASSIYADNVVITSLQCHGTSDCLIEEDT